MAEEEERNVIITPDDSNNPEEQGEAVKHLEAVVEGLLNFSVDNDGGEIKNPEEICEVGGGLSEKRTHCDYPLRPHAQDCASYLRTGSCKYGLICKFNHPLGRGFQGDQNQKSWSDEQASQIECKFYQTPEGCKYGKKDCWFSHPKEKSGPELLEGMTQQDNYFMEHKGQTACKYYLTSEGCKYGNACRYSHSKQFSFRFTEKSELAPPELNFLGLPIRELEKECTFYMRTGTCGYGVKCMYNHPDPTAAGGSKTPLSNGKLSGNLNQVSAPVSSLGISETASTSRSSDNSTQEGTFPWLDSSLPYFTHDMNLDSGSAMEQRRIGNTNTSYRPYQTIIHEEFPERPAEPHCSYFMKTGNCKFKSACRFHHPKTRAPTLPSGFSVSSMGLPLRPGRQICWHYERSGECRHGLLCLFDHPENFASPSPFPF